jgi:hypothetical protein
VIEKRPIERVEHHRATVPEAASKAWMRAIRSCRARASRRPSFHEATIHTTTASTASTLTDTPGNRGRDAEASGRRNRGPERVAGSGGGSAGDAAATVGESSAGMRAMTFTTNPPVRIVVAFARA